jgi:hypothetical protein
VKNAPRSVRIQRPTARLPSRKKHSNYSAALLDALYTGSPMWWCGCRLPIHTLHMYTTIYFPLCVKFLQQVACLITVCSVSQREIYSINEGTSDVVLGRQVSHLGRKKFLPYRPALVAAARLLVTDFQRGENLYRTVVTDVVLAVWCMGPTHWIHFHIVDPWTHSWNVERVEIWN